MFPQGGPQPPPALTRAQAEAAVRLTESVACFSTVNEQEALALTKAGTLKSSASV